MQESLERMLLFFDDMSIRLARLLFGRTACAGMIVLIFSSVQAQNLFVSDVGSSNVYEFTPGGARSTFASLAGGDASGLAFDSAGDLFVASQGSGNVYKFTPDGTRSTFASGLPHPVALAFNSAGDLFVGNDIGGQIYEFTPSGSESTFASGLQPSGLAFNRAGDLFEADWISGQIYEFTPDGTRTTFASEEVFYDPAISPFALAFDGAGNLFVGNDVTTSHYIVEFTPDGAGKTFVSSGLTSACGLAFNSAGELFEADWGSGNIYKFTPDGTRSTFASGLVNPVALAFQPAPELTATVTKSAFKVTVSMPSPSHSTIIQASPDMLNWINIYTNTPPFTFIEPMVTAGARFYRVTLGQ